MHFSASLDVPAPAQRVWDVMTTLALEPQWMTAVSSVSFVRAEAYQTGARMRRKGRFLKKALVWESELAHVAPGVGATFRHSGAFSGQSTWNIAPTSDGCRVTLATDGPDPLGLKVLGRLMAIAGQRGVRSDLERLRALVLSRG